MGQNSHIEWCDHTFNPWEGCTKVSPGCAHCYAEARNKRWAGGANWGKGAPRRRTTEANWRQPLKWNRDQAKVIATCGGDMRAEEYRDPRVFCASLADWLDDEVPIEWLVDLLALIRSTPNLDWLLLTKRPENWKSRLDDVCRYLPSPDPECYPDSPRTLQDWIIDWYNGDVPENISIGATVEDQQRADERHPALMGIPARVHFWSNEPSLSLIDSTKLWAKYGKPDWEINGGESGPHARPMHPNWPRQRRDQCLAAGVPFFFKQWGEWLPRTAGVMSDELLRSEMPTIRLSQNGRNGQTDPEADEQQVWLGRVGKKAAGALLDGREWKQFPEVIS